MNQLDVTNRLAVYTRTRAILRADAAEAAAEWAAQDWLDGCNVCNGAADLKEKAGDRRVDAGAWCWDMFQWHSLQWHRVQWHCLQPIIVRNSCMTRMIARNSCTAKE